MVSELAIVSGATGGIGRAVVERLWKAGYSVLALGRSPEKLQALHDWLTGTPHSRCQVSYTVAMTFPDADYARLAAYCECHQRLGGEIALLAVCHGAVPQPGPFATCEQALRDVLMVDVLATVRLCQAIGESMRVQGSGSICLVSSLHSRISYPERAAYVVGKSALSGLVRSLALDWGRYGIRTNAVLPWQVRGPRTDGFIAAYRDATGQDLEERYKQRSPMRRLVEAEDVADAVLFLARNTACNGVELVLDGGVSQNMWYEGYKEEHHNAD